MPAEYVTTDIYLAAFLCSRGIALRGMRRAGPKRVEFRFVASADVHALLRLYWTGHLTPIVPWELFLYLRRLKNLSIAKDAPAPTTAEPPARSWLTTLRRSTPQMTPARFLHAQPGSIVRYHDDTPAKDPSKALSTARFDSEQAKKKQREGCAVRFSLQAFEGGCDREHLLVYHNLGVEIDLATGADRAAVAAPEMDRRKDDYLVRYLRPFPLRPHWLVETAHGFHAIFRIMPLRDPARIRQAEVLNRRLVAALRGNMSAVLLAQCLRVPGTRQFTDPARPFLCRLLMDHASMIPPYEIERVRAALCARDESRDGPAAACGREAPSEESWPDALAGMPDARRSAASAVVADILRRLPESLRETGDPGSADAWARPDAPPLSGRGPRPGSDSRDMPPQPAPAEEDPLPGSPFPGLTA